MGLVFLQATWAGGSRGLLEGKVTAPGVSRCGPWVSDQLPRGGGPGLGYGGLRTWEGKGDKAPGAGSGQEGLLLCQPPSQEGLSNSVNPIPPAKGAGR